MRSRISSPNELVYVLIAIECVLELREVIVSNSLKFFKQLKLKYTRTVCERGMIWAISLYINISVLYPLFLINSILTLCNYGVNLSFSSGDDD